MSDPNWPPPPPPPYVPAPPRAPEGSDYASAGIRAVALLIDGVIVLALFLLAIVVAGSIDGTAGAAVAIVSYLALLVYAPLTMMRPGTHNGQTLGKQALGIRVVRETGEPVGFWYAAVRELFAKGIIGPLTLYIDFLWPIWDERRQALHDKLVSTLVVRA